MKEKIFDQSRILLDELQALEARGISIWLEGEQSNSAQVIEAMAVRENNSYMRDYVFEKGKVSQLRFDRVDDC